MAFSRTCSIAAVLSFLLLLVGCKEPNELGGVAGTNTAAPTGGAVDSPRNQNKPGYLAGELCNVESVDDKAFGAEPIRLDAPSRVRGWLADGGGRVPERPMLVLVDQDKNVVAQYPLTLAASRPDVVQAFPEKPIPAKSGFEVRLDPAGVPPKRYHLYLTYAAGGQLFVCDNGRNVQVP